MKNKFGQHVLTLAQIKKLLNRKASVYLHNYCQTNLYLDHNFDKKILKELISVIAKWSVRNGALYFSHFFYSLDNIPSLKMNALVKDKLDYDAFLCQEVDGSSFITGDKVSITSAKGLSFLCFYQPIFIYNNVVYLPAILMDNHFTHLDNTIPLIKSNKQLSSSLKQLLDALHYPNYLEILPSIGLEQELYIVNKNDFLIRDDTRLLSKVLIGGIAPSFNQKYRSYLRPISQQIINFIDEVKQKLSLLGITIQVFHHENSFKQYEISLLYNHSLLTIFHYRLLYMVLNDTASRYGLKCVFIELPFKGLSGSGKHLNYSLITNTHVNLFNFKNNLELFFVLLTIMISSLSKYQNLLVIGGSSYENEYRLGVKEAPLGNISLFIDQIILDNYIKYLKDENIDDFISLIKNNKLDILLSRNREAAISFNYNKFEFRVIGASLDPSFFLIILNTILANEIDELICKLNNNNNIKDICYQLFIDSKNIIIPFSRNNLSTDFYIKNICHLLSPTNLELFDRYHIFSERELKMRANIYYDDYINSFLNHCLVLEKLVYKSFFPIKETTLKDNHKLNKIFKLVKYLSNLIINRNIALDKENQCIYLYSRVLPIYNKIIKLCEKLDKNIILKPSIDDIILNLD